MQPFRARLRIFFSIVVPGRLRIQFTIVVPRKAADLINYRRAGEGTGSKTCIELNFCRLPAERGRV